jgi:uncharacterized protein (DUF983 family)
VLSAPPEALERSGPDGDVGQITEQAEIVHTLCAMPDAPPTPSWGKLFGRALLMRCPVCGQRKIFRRWLKMADRCPNCGFVFERQEGHFIGAVGMNTIITIVALMGSIAVGMIITAPDMAVGPILAVAIGITIVLPVIIHPVCRMLWTAIHLLMQPLEPGEAPWLAGKS